MPRRKKVETGPDGWIRWKGVEKKTIKRRKKVEIPPELPEHPDFVLAPYYCCFCGSECDIQSQSCGKCPRRCQN